MCNDEGFRCGVGSKAGKGSEMALDFSGRKVTRGCKGNRAVVLYYRRQIGNQRLSFRSKWWTTRTYHRQLKTHPRNHRPVQDKRTLAIRVQGGAEWHCVEVHDQRRGLNGLVLYVECFGTGPKKANGNRVLTGPLRFPFVPVAVQLFVE